MPLVQQIHHQAGIQRHGDEQPHAHRKSGVDVLARQAVLHRLPEQDNQGDQGVEPEARAKPPRAQAIELARQDQGEQQHPQEEHPQVHKNGQRAPERNGQQAAE